MDKINYSEVQRVLYWNESKLPRRDLKLILRYASDADNSTAEPLIKALNNLKDPKKIVILNILFPLMGSIMLGDFLSCLVFWWIVSISLWEPTNLVIGILPICFWLTEIVLSYNRTKINNFISIAKVMVYK